MDTLFRRKGRSRQFSVSTQDLNERSVPYDKLAPPLPVNTITHRGISAPNTNPALTASGTEFNKFAFQRSRIYDQNGYELRPGSPSASVSTADSSTLYEESFVSPIPKQLPQTPQSSRVRLSQASLSSTPRTPNDLGNHSLNASASSVTIRPTSTATTRSEASRSSRYAPSLSASESSSHHSLFYHSRSHHGPETFHFPRPETNAEIEALFENVKRTRDLSGSLDDLSIDQKWHMVYNDEQIRWAEEQSRKQRELGNSTGDVAQSPEWYLRKFMDRTITPKQAASLLVCLRSRELGWFKDFVNLRGTSVLAQTLRHINQTHSRFVTPSFALCSFLMDKLGTKTILSSSMTRPDVSNIYLTIPYYITSSVLYHYTYHRAIVCS